MAEIHINSIDPFPIVREIRFNAHTQHQLLRAFYDLSPEVLLTSSDEKMRGIKQSLLVFSDKEDGVTFTVQHANAKISSREAPILCEEEIAAFMKTRCWAIFTNFGHALRFSKTKNHSYS